MSFTRISFTEEPRQIQYFPETIDDHSFTASLELRYLSAPNRWFLTLGDAITGETFVRGIPLVCSYGKLNDLLYPFRHLPNSVGSFFCLKAVDEPTTPDPTASNLSEFQLWWGDTLPQDPAIPGWVAISE